MANDNAPPVTDAEVAAIIAQQRAPGEERPTEILKFFRYDHLPERQTGQLVGLRDISKVYAQLAAMTVLMVPSSAERTAGLRKLLEAKDCAVRAALP